MNNSPARHLVTCTLFCMLAAVAAHAQAGTPKYAADVPVSITIPDTVQTERLGTLKFFDGLPDEATVKKVYDNLDFTRGMESFLPAYQQPQFVACVKG